MSAAFQAPEGASASNLAPAPGNSVAFLATRLSKLTLDVIAQTLRCDDTKACKVRSGEKTLTVQEFAALLGAAHLKLVDKDKVCVDRRAYDAMSYISSKALGNQQTAQTLVWDEEQG